METASIEVVSNRLHMQVPLYSVLWIDTRQNAILLHTDAGVIKTYTTYTKMKKRLDKCTDCFLTCYKGCLVNMRRISHVQDADFIMENGERVQVRKRDGSRIRKSWLLYRCAQT